VAEEYLRQGLAVRSPDVQSRKLLIRSLMLQNKLEESSAELALMPKGAFADDQIDLARGEIELALGKLVEAEALLRSAYDAKPDSKTLAYLNVALMRQGKTDEALKLGEAWLKANSDDQLILRQMGPAYLAVGRDDDATRVYEALNQLSPDDPLVRNNLAWILRKTDSKRALEYVDSALVAAPGNASILDTKAMVLMEAGEYDQALSVIQQALDASEQHPQFQLHRAEILAAAGRPKEAVAVIEALLEDERFADNANVNELLQRYKAL
jgi:tetratricopeptide (TPR) repeat protein